MNEKCYNTSEYKNNKLWPIIVAHAPIHVTMPTGGLK